MDKKQVLYFDHAGHQNTQSVINAVRQSVDELNIKYVVVASISGETGVQFWQALQDTDCQVISVSVHAGFNGKDDISLSEEKKKEMENEGIKTLITSHALAGVGRSISNNYGGITDVQLIADTLKLFGDGMKVAVEVSIMAADAGLIPTDKEIIAVGGTSSGADTATVLKAAHMNNFFDLEIREIIAMPRQKGKWKKLKSKALQLQNVLKV